MGLFSSSKKVFVDSVAYNMAGELALRPNYLKSTVSRSVLVGNPRMSLGEVFIDSQLNGPTFDQRQFFRWAYSQYPEGMCSGQLTDLYQLSATDALALSGLITVPVGYTLYVQSAVLDSADVVYWAEKHILDTRPVDYPTAWTAEFDTASGKVKITYPDTSTELVTLVNFDAAADYIFGYYSLIEDATDEQTQSIHIYKIGSGTTSLDDLVSAATSMPQFYPIIPLRRDNKSISHADYSSIFTSVSRAYKKTTGRGIQSVLDEIEGHADIDDIDHAFVVYGVELNAHERAGRAYIYDFLKELSLNQGSTVAAVNSWTSSTNYIDYVNDYNTWLAAQEDPLDPLYGTAPPASVERPVLDYSTLTVESDTGVAFPLNYKIKLHWLAIEESDNTGLGKVGATKGEYWWDIQPDIADPGVQVFTDDGASGYTASNTSQQNLSHVKLYWQYDTNDYKVLDIYGLSHENIIYQGNSVKITAKEALNNADESGFIIPLHWGTLKAMPLVLANELSITNKLIVFNSYQVVSQRWWQSSAFQFLFGIALSVAVAVVFPGAGGILGANLIIGTSLGFTGTAALIAGAVANAIAAMIISSVLRNLSQGLLGDKWGGLVASVAGFIALHAISGLLTSGTFSINWADLMRPENLLQLTNAITGGVSAWIRGRMGEIQNDLTSGQEEYSDQMQEIQNLMNELLGYSGAIINPLMLLEAPDSSSLVVESSDTFLTRTLLTGSDIADMSLSMIDSFAEVSLTLPRSFA